MSWLSTWRGRARSAGVPAPDVQRPDPAVRGGTAPAAPLDHLAAAMVAARTAAGLSLRETAARLGYRSHTMLIQYEKARVPPTDEVVDGYERVLGLADGELRTLLEDARTAAHGDPFPKRRRRTNGREGPPRDRTRPPVVAVVTAVMVTAVVTGAVVLVLTGILRPEPEVRVPGGSDPRTAGCDADAVSTARVDVHLPSRFRLGVLELRSSARCGTGWGRFLQADGMPPTPFDITITTVRPADGARAPFSMTYAGQNVYGDQLVNRYQCVYAEIAVVRDGQVAPVTRTACATT